MADKPTLQQFLASRRAFLKKAGLLSGAGLRIVSTSSDGRFELLSDDRHLFYAPVPETTGDIRVEAINRWGKRFTAKLS